MPGRILIAEPIATNRIALRVMLTRAFYDVSCVVSGSEALAHLTRTPCDILIASKDLGDMQGAELCAAVAAAPDPARVPVLLILDTPGQDACCHAIAQGADDCLVRPIDETLLLARLRSLLRARDAEAELRLRDDTERALGLAENAAEFATPARIAFVPTWKDPDLSAELKDMAQRLGAKCVQRSPSQVLRGEADQTDVFVIVEGNLPGGEALSLLSGLRTNTATRHAGILYVAGTPQTTVAATALDLGANDLMSGGLRRDELTVRLDKLSQRKRMADRLRANMRLGLNAALTDPLTGLYNRRYAMPHLDRLAKASRLRDHAFAVVVIDLDHFKTINDTFGHGVGDVVLTDVARHLGNEVRAADLIARLGGEEFMIAMPDTDATLAEQVAQRLCVSLARLRIAPGGDAAALQVTGSFGVAVSDAACHETAEDVIRRADAAMYDAKRQGRNRVALAAPPDTGHRPAFDGTYAIPVKGSAGA